MTEKFSPAPVLPELEPACLPMTAEKEVIFRQKIIDEAMSWRNTPYRQQADIKGAGVDCSMLLVRCWVDAGIVKPFDPRPYPPNWHMNHSEERYLAWMNTVAIEVPTPQPGDVAIFKYGRCYAHGGIMTGPNSIVHAASGFDRCIRSNLDEPWIYYDKHGGKLKPRPRKFFDIFAKLKGMH